MNKSLLSIFLIAVLTFSTFAISMENNLDDYGTTRQKAKYGCPSVFDLAYRYCPSADTFKKVGVCMLTVSIIFLPMMAPLGMAFAHAKEEKKGPGGDFVKVSDGVYMSTSNADWARYNSRIVTNPPPKTLGESPFSRPDSYLKRQIPDAQTIGQAYSRLIEGLYVRAQEISYAIRDLNVLEEKYWSDGVGDHASIKLAQSKAIESAIKLAQERLFACKELGDHWNWAGAPSTPWAAMLSALRSLGEDLRMHPVLDVCSGEHAEKLRLNFISPVSPDGSVAASLASKIEECRSLSKTALEAALANEAIMFSSLDPLQKTFLYFSEFSPNTAEFILDWFPFIAKGTLLAASMAVGAKIASKCCQSKNKKKPVIPGKDNRPGPGQGPPDAPSPAPPRAPNVTKKKETRDQRLAREARERLEDSEAKKVAAREEQHKREAAQREKQKAANAESEARRDREVCAAMADGSVDKKGAFYSSIKNILEEMRSAGSSRDELNAFIGGQWEAYRLKLLGQTKSAKMLSKKSNLTRSRPQEPKRAEPIETDKKSSVLTKASVKPVSSIYSNANSNNEINWNEPVEKKKNKKKPKAAKAVSLASEPQHPLIMAAINEYLFLEGLLPWYNQLHRQDPIHAEIVADNMWYASLLFYNSLLENDRLRKIDARFGEDQQPLCPSLFTVNDNDFRVIRNVIMHNFPDELLLKDHCTTTLLKFLGPALKDFCGAHTANAHAVDLAETALFKCPMAEFNVNQRIEREFKKIQNYFRHLNSKEAKQREAFELLELQNSGKDIFQGYRDFKVYDVYAARAIEACLARLGKLFLLYIEQDLPDQTLPATVVGFMRDLNQRFRKLVAHQIDVENKDWHYSPVPAAAVEAMMNRAVELSQLAQQAEAPRPRFNPAAAPFSPAKF